MKVGFVGIGDMGIRMARNVMKNHDLFVHNRTKSKAQPLMDEGASWVEYPKDFQTDLVILMLTDDEACKDMIMGKNGIIHTSNRPMIVNMSTITPHLSIKLYHQLQETGYSYFEAPVSGTLPHAEQANLIILAGGDKDELEKVRPVLNLMGRRIDYLGEIGSAAKAKVLINSMLAVHTGILAEFLTLSKQFGLEPEQMLEIINDSALGNIVSQAKGRNMLSDQHQTLFRYRYLIKDLDYALETINNKNLHAPLISKITEIYKNGSDEVLDLDFSAISRTYGLY